MQKITPNATNSPPDSQTNPAQKVDALERTSNILQGPSLLHLSGDYLTASACETGILIVLLLPDAKGLHLPESSYLDLKL